MIRNLIIYSISCLLSVVILSSCGGDTTAIDISSSFALSSQVERVSFMTFGDWGDGSTRQKAVANAMTKYCKNWDCDFVVTLGDNFYQKGVEDIYDSLWQTRYRQIYGRPGRMNWPFYAALGNHDVMGSKQAQIDYSTIDNSWHMSAPNYSIAFPKDLEVPIVEIFIINTGENEFQSDEEAWLIDALAKSKAAWKLLVTHVPIINNGLNYGDGNFNNGDHLISDICGKIDLVMSGHEHIFSHLTGKNKNFDVDCVIEQLIIGTGGAGTYNFVIGDQRAHKDGSIDNINGFGWFHATHGELLFRMIDSNGVTVYETSWQKALGQ